MGGRRRGRRHEGHEHDRAENSVSAGTEKSCRFCKKNYRARILIESARFPPFGFATPEISSNSIENMENASTPDSDRERSVSPLRVRHTRDKL